MRRRRKQFLRRGPGVFLDDIRHGKKGEKKNGGKCLILMPNITTFPWKWRYCSNFSMTWEPCFLLFLISSWIFAFSRLKIRTLASTFNHSTGPEVIWFFETSILITGASKLLKIWKPKNARVTAIRVSDRCYNLYARQHRVCSPKTVYTAVFHRRSWPIVVALHFILILNLFKHGITSLQNVHPVIDVL